MSSLRYDSGGIKVVKVAQGGTSFLSLLGILFIGLKLTGYIDWDWWWVLWPLWSPFALVGAVGMLGLTGLLIGSSLGWWKK